jgi:predicted component of type VI protein secretion system
VIRLREWGSDTIYPLPRPPSPAAPRPQGDWFVGTAPECLLRLEDPSGYVSRRHARLLREPAYWSLLDLGSKNGMRVNGTLQATARLTPGTEIGLGGLTLIAESARSIEIRCFLARLLGWTAERAVDIDLALRAVRLAQVQRTPLVLRGEGDLVPLARDLHRRVLGRSRPFVLCDPHRQSVEENVRVSANIECGRVRDHSVRVGVGAHRDTSSRCSHCP